MSFDDRVRPPRLVLIRGKKDVLVFDAGYEGGAAYFHEHRETAIHVKNLEEEIDKRELPRNRLKWVVLSDEELFNDDQIAKIRKLVNDEGDIEEPTT